jgi:uncharacterized phosphosugar-binding protein
MSRFAKGAGLRTYLEEVQALQARVVVGQAQTLTTVAEQMAETIAAGGRIFVFGTGHSHLMAEEAFYRAGGLAPVVPIFSATLMLHRNPERGSRLERSEGLAAPLLEWYGPEPGEMLFIFSNSGVNRLPVEMALEAKARELTVVAVLSRAYAGEAPLSSLGKRLDQVADLTIDNGGAPGDALVSLNGTGWRVGPTSTVIGALIWNALVAETATCLKARGLEVPVFASLNMEGAAAHNAALLEKWRPGNPHL